MRSTHADPFHNLNLRPLVRRFVIVNDDEVETLQFGFGAFFCVLASYFLLLPIRDEAGVTLGTSSLPLLFTASFFLILLVQPLVSQYLLQANKTPDRALHQLYRVLACSLLGFFVAYLLFSHEPPSSAGEDLAAPDRRHHSRLLAEAARPIWDVRRGDAGLSMLQRAVRAAFFLWLSVSNLVCLSTLWARVADIFGSNAAARLFGFLGAGATCGQLAGSLLATAYAAFLQARSSAGGDGRRLHDVALQAAPMLLSAALLEAAGQMAGRLRQASPQAPPPAPAQPGKRAWSSPGPHRSPFQSPQRAGGGGQGLAAQLWHSFARMWAGFALIAQSEYLCTLCLYVVLSTTISSFLYFERAMVVAAAAGSSAARMALFAQINSASALVIAALQLAATGHLLRRLGLARALACSPAVATLLMLGIAAAPSPLMVASGEVLRKVINYVLARPAREVLFTVTSREEKYAAKLCIDTLVVRGGDALSAGAFHVLDGLLHLGASGCAAAAVPICMGCTAVAYSLGRKQEAMAAQQRQSSDGVLSRAEAGKGVEESVLYGSPAAGQGTQRLRASTHDTAAS